MCSGPTFHAFTGAEPTQKTTDNTTTKNSVSQQPPVSSRDMVQPGFPSHQVDCIWIWAPLFLLFSGLINPLNVFHFCSRLLHLCRFTGQHLRKSSRHRVSNQKNVLTLNTQPMDTEGHGHTLAGGTLHLPPASVCWTETFYSHFIRGERPGYTRRLALSSLCTPLCAGHKHEPPAAHTH